MNTMTLTLGSILHSAGIDPADAQAIRHAYVREHEDTGSQGIHADSTDEEILQYTRRQWVDPRRFPLNPPRFWVIFVRGAATVPAFGLSWKIAGRSRTTDYGEASISWPRITWPTFGTDS
jgi:hypothetical protein